LEDGGIPVIDKWAGKIGHYVHMAMIVAVLWWMGCGESTLTLVTVLGIIGWREAERQEDKS